VNSAFSLILGLSLAGGATCLIVIAASALVKNRLRKSWLYYLWLIALLRFILPVPLSLPFLPDSVGAVTSVISPAAAPAPASALIGSDLPAAPNDVQTETEPALTNNLAGGSTNDAEPAGDAPAGSIAGPAAAALPEGGLISGSTAGTTAGISVNNLLAFIWLTGASAMLLWTVTGYALTCRKLRRGRTLLMRERVPVYKCACVTVPILAGIVRPEIYLPTNFPNPELAVRHELTHLRRGDIWLKWLVQLTVCVHWFNPFVWLMKRELNRLVELACDRAAVRGLDPEERNSYGQMLLDTARTISGRNGELIAFLGKDKHLMAERLRELFHTEKATRRSVTAISALCVVVLATAVLFGVFVSACTANSKTNSPDMQSGAPSVNGTATPSAGASTGVPEGFISDPDVIGTWEPFNLAHTVSDFVPGEKMAFSAYSLVFAPDGVTSLPNETWTNGAVLVADYGFTQNYTIREINGTKYLFLQRPAGYPVDFLGDTYDYYVYKWASEKVDFQLYTDDIDLPFMDDPAVHGTWRYVKNAISSNSPYVSDQISVDAFDVSSPFLGDYARLEMTFSDGGVLRTIISRGALPASRTLTWTKDVVIDPYLKTASAYELKEISGTTYLIMENKAESYIRSKPENRLTKYYTVWIRTPEPAPAEMRLPEDAPPGFVDDPELVGTWMPYGLAQDDYKFTTMWITGSALVAYNNGWTNEPNMTWSKGTLTLSGNYEAADLVREYIIREIGGRRFLYVKPPASSAIYLNMLNMDYEYTVYLWISEPVPDAIYTDDIDLPFVNDPAVLGDWKLAASVRNIDDYNPSASPQFVTYLPQRTMTFADGGSLSLITAGTPGPSGFSWTKGVVIDPYLKTASAYEFREIDGVTYLFMERKDIQNYTHMHVIGGYTVWRKTVG
jgi:beta-lactamase regulating signal transducer with metallopeptidase domain